MSIAAAASPNSHGTSAATNTVHLARSPNRCRRCKRLSAVTQLSRTINDPPTAVNAAIVGSARQHRIDAANKTTHNTARHATSPTVKLSRSRGGRNGIGAGGGL